MEYFDYIRYASFALNGIALFLWLKSKFVLTEFLQGSWKGNLEVKEDTDHIIECTLIVACHKDRDNSALLYYERKRLACGTIVTRGIDKLEKYPDNLSFFWNGSWNPTFQRKAHIPLVANEPDEEVDTLVEASMPKRYQWTCEVTNRFFKPKMSVTITHDDCVFEGVFAKR